MSVRQDPTTPHRSSIAAVLAAASALLLTSGALYACSDEDGGAPTASDAGVDAPTPPVADAAADATPLPDPLDLTSVGADGWGWYEFPGTVCRDGTPTGIGVSPSPTGVKKVLFFFQGGGMCVDGPTCATNPASTKAHSLAGGVFDRSRPENPFAQYTHVFVPYCTGDLHGGNNPDGDVADVGKQKFVGYTNAEFFLKKVAATFPDVERLVLAGESAGGFAATINFGQARRIFPSPLINVIDDSGPALRDPRLSHCLQEEWKNAWGLDKTMIAECGDACVGNPDFVSAAFNVTVQRANHAVGLISSSGDDTIRIFYALGGNDCNGVADKMTEADFAAGIADIRSQLASSTNFGAFIYGGTNHMLSSRDLFYSTKVGDKNVSEWVRGIVESDAVSNVGP